MLGCLSKPFALFLDALQCLAVLGEAGGQFTHLGVQLVDDSLQLR